MNLVAVVLNWNGGDDTLGALAFGLPQLVVGPYAAAVAGLVAYCVALALWRPAGLRQAWGYVRTLQ